MKQIYSNYSKEDFEVWRILFSRQKKELEKKACSEYLECLDELGSDLDENAVPDFKKLDKRLMEASGWSIKVVPGLIPVEEFFELLSKKRFCSSTWLRKMNQLDYLEEPDMFHDIFGHIPLLMNKNYADFMQLIGKLGVKHIDNAKAINGLRNLYWYTIEFGVLNDPDNPEIYGAGIISSFGESKHIYDKSKVEIKEFEIDDILEKVIVTSEIQNLYYSIPDLDSLYKSMDGIEKRLENINA